MTTLRQPEPAPLPPAVGDAVPPPLQGLALDGKAVRGVGRRGHPCQLVSLVAHGSGNVLAQAAVARKRDERSVVPQLLEGRNLHATVLTMDALHTLRKRRYGFSRLQSHGALQSAGRPGSDVTANG